MLISCCYSTAITFFTVSLFAEKETMGDKGDEVEITEIIGGDSKEKKESPPKHGYAVLLQSPR
jgi:hypothetical protein